MSLFGGLRGGRKRADGLAAGSPEAIAADKAADAERKRVARQEAARLAEPPPLPSALESAPGVSAPAMPGVGTDVRLAVAALVPWEVEKLKGLTDELIQVAEEADVDSFVKVATAGKLPDAVVKKIGKDSAWHPAGRAMLKRATPRLAAKYLNKTGISAEFQDELEWGGAVVLILRQRSAMMRELREMIAELKAAATAKAN